MTGMNGMTGSWYTIVEMSSIRYSLFMSKVQVGTSLFKGCKTDMNLDTGLSLEKNRGQFLIIHNVVSIPHTLTKSSTKLKEVKNLYSDLVRDITKYVRKIEGVCICRLIVIFSVLLEGSFFFYFFWLTRVWPKQ